MNPYLVAVEGRGLSFPRFEVPVYQGGSVFLHRMGDCDGCVQVNESDIMHICMVDTEINSVSCMCDNGFPYINVFAAQVPRGRCCEAYIVRRPDARIVGH